MLYGYNMPMNEGIRYIATGDVVHRTTYVPDIRTKVYQNKSDTSNYYAWQLIIRFPEIVKELL